MQTAIHPQYYSGRSFENGALVNFWAKGTFRSDNANSIELIFGSGEYHDKDGDEPLERDRAFVVKDTITIFHLSATDAELLASIGRMSDKQRAKILPMVREILAEKESDDG